MSGSSSSKSSSSSTTNNVDKRLVVDNGAIGVSADNSTVNVTDNGAVSMAIDLAKFTETGGLKGYEDLLALTGQTFNSVFDIVKKNSDTVDHITSTVTSAVQDARTAELKATNDNRYLVAAGLAVVGIVAVKVWSK